jgi:hypothetical protein
MNARLASPATEPDKSRTTEFLFDIAGGQPTR